MLFSDCAENAGYIEIYEKCKPRCKPTFDYEHLIFNHLLHIEARKCKPEPANAPNLHEWEAEIPQYWNSS